VGNEMKQITLTDQEKKDQRFAPESSDWMRVSGAL
jgi:hypothetical protein